MRIAEGEREKVANQFSVVGSRWAYSPKPMMGIIERQRSSDRQASKSSGGAEVFFSTTTSSSSSRADWLSFSGWTTKSIVFYCVPRERWRKRRTVYSEFSIMHVR